MNQQIFMQMQQGMNPFDPTQSLQKQPAFKGKQKTGTGKNDSSGGGPDASNRVDNIIASKTNLSNKTSKPSAGGGGKLRTGG